MSNRHNNHKLYAISRKNMVTGMPPSIHPTMGVSTPSKIMLTGMALIMHP
jgi:hypothetical protein